MKSYLKLIIPYVYPDKKAILFYQFARKWHLRGIKSISLFYEHLILTKYSCALSPLSIIDINTKFPHFIGIVIGANVEIKKNVTIYQNVTIGRKDKNTLSAPRIHEGVIIYPHSVLVGDIEIGQNSIIGAGSFVDKNIPANHTIINGKLKRNSHNLS